jgi:hypothetical protein
MTLYEFQPDAIVAVPEASFGGLNLTERGDIQRLLRDRVEIVCPDAMVLSEEFASWEESKRRIDLLALDRHARLVIIELKRTEDGGHMELQAIRYAAMISTMTFSQAVAAHASYLSKREIDEDAEESILQFLGWSDPDEDAFGNDVRLVLIAADFSREITTSALWLAGFDIDISCVRLRPYALDGKVLVDVQRIIPLPEAAEYMEKVREKGRAERKSRSGGRDYTRFDVTIDGDVHERQPKRRAVWLVVKKLCDSGISPEAISDAVPWKKRLWRSVEGEVDGTGYIVAAERDAAQGGPAFDAKRWFCADDELIRHEGRTHAVTNQWGGKTGPALRDWHERWPDRGFDYAVSPE